MEAKEKKCVMVLDESLPRGMLANVAAILGITLGKQAPEVVGPEVPDLEGKRHLGIIQFPVPILKGTAETMRQLRAKLFAEEYADLTVVDFTDLAQGCKTYEDFTKRLSVCPEGDLTYLGVALLGTKKQVDRLTGALPLLR